MPTNAPEPRGNAVSTHCLVDADHAGNKVTRIYQTAILLFANKLCITWYSKRHNSVEDSTSGSEFITLRQAKNLIVAFRYKLRMCGMLIDGPTNVFCDNESVTKSVWLPELTLNNKCLSICYHSVRESVAADTLWAA